MLARKLYEEQGNFGYGIRRNSACSLTGRVDPPSQFSVFKISASISRSVISNQDALSRALRPPAGCTQDSFVSLPAGLGRYGLRGAAAAFEIGRQTPRPDLQRWADTKVFAKSANVLSEIPSDKAGDSARQRFSSYRFSKSLCPCARDAAGLLFSDGICSFNQEVSAWRCHRHETDPNL
jgi:hypothetical protein